MNIIRNTVRGALVFLATALVITLSGCTPPGQIPEKLQVLFGEIPAVNAVKLAKKYDLPTQVVDGVEKVVFTYITNDVQVKGKKVSWSKRAKSDSVNIPIPEKWVERDRILASIVTQPEMAGMTGVALAEHYPELVKIHPELFDQFVGVEPKIWYDKVFSGEISYDDAAETMVQLAGILSVFEWSSEPESHKTTWNYHALAGAITHIKDGKVDVRPIIQNTKEYTGDFLVLRLSYKGEPICIADEEALGFNVGVDGKVSKGDQRIAGVKTSCDKPAPKATKTPPQKVVKEKCKKNCTPPTKPPEKDKAKKPKQDPNQQGKAPVGGGANKPEDGKGSKSEHTPAPETPRPTPAAPVPAPAPEPTKTPEVTRPTEKPKPAPKAPEPTKPAESGELVDP